MNQFLKHKNKNIGCLKITNIENSTKIENWFLKIPVRRTGSIGLSANSFRFYFTGRPALLFAFPSRYLFTIGRKLYLALENGFPRFRRRVCTGVLRNSLGPVLILRTRLSLSMADHSITFRYLNRSHIGSYNPLSMQASTRFGLMPFRSPLLRQSFQFLFLRVLRCFSSPGSLLTLNNLPEGKYLGIRR